MKSLEHLLMLLLLSCPLLSTAQPVQKWQDAQGQWHFGDAVAAGGQSRRTQPVYVDRRISVVHQDHAWPVYRTPAPAPARTRARPAAPDAEPARLTQAECAVLRDSLRLLRPDQQRHRQEFYEKNCIQGRYYGQASGS